MNMVGLTRAQRILKETQYTSKPKAEEQRLMVESVVSSMKEPRIQTSADERAAEIRRTRSEGFGAQRTFDLVTERLGWYRRWVNDNNIPGRLAEGWTFVSKSQVKDTTSLGFEGVDVSDRLTKPNKATNPDGNAGMTTLMEIPDVIAKEIQKARVDDPADRIDATIRGGTIGIDEANRQYTYSPTPIRMGYKP